LSGCLAAGGGGGGGDGFGPKRALFTPGARSGNGLVKITWRQSISDVAVSINATPSPISQNGDLAYTITITNAGPNAAQQLTINDTLPSASGFISEDSTEASCIDPSPGATGTLSCSIRSLANNGATATILIYIQDLAPAGQTLSDSVDVATASLDPNSANNTATVTTYVTS
jgi:uncharacterized repeat protein (TIGR01451 family)